MHMFTSLCLNLYHNSYHIIIYNEFFFLFISLKEISTLNVGSLKVVDKKFTYLGSSISSTENDISMRLAKA